MGIVLGPRSLSRLGEMRHLRHPPFDAPRTISYVSKMRRWFPTMAGISWRCLEHPAEPIETGPVHQDRRRTEAAAPPIDARGAAYGDRRPLVPGHRLTPSGPDYRAAPTGNTSPVVLVGE